MRKLIFGFLVVSLTMVYTTVSAQELMYIDTRGYRHFSCSVGRRGAKVVIKEMRGEKFQIRSSLYTGVLHLPAAAAKDRWCTGMMGAARVICGLCPHPQSKGKVEDRKKQLGLSYGQ